MTDANDRSGVEVVSSCLIKNNKGEILLIKSHKWDGVYLIPGGHVEPSETFAEAAKREGEEETGLKLKTLYCVNVGELINDPSFHRKAHLVYFHYVCEALTEDVILDESELQEHIWVDPKESLELNVPDGLKETIKNFINGVKFEITSEKLG